MIRLPIRNRVGVVIAHALLDDEDYEIAERHTWSLDNDGYAVGGWRKSRVRMARAVVNLATGDPREVDHINRNRLDNRRANLRVVPRGANAQNRTGWSASGCRNVYWLRGKWMVNVKRGGKSFYGGLFDNLQEADGAAIELRERLFEWNVEPDAIQA